MLPAGPKSAGLLRDEASAGSVAVLCWSPTPIKTCGGVMHTAGGRSFADRALRCVRTTVAALVQQWREPFFWWRELRVVVVEATAVDLCMRSSKSETNPEGE